MNLHNNNNDGLSIAMIAKRCQLRRLMTVHNKQVVNYQQDVTCFSYITGRDMHVVKHLNNIWLMWLA